MVVCCACIRITIKPGVIVIMMHIYAVLKSPLTTIEITKDLNIYRKIFKLHQEFLDRVNCK